MNAQLPIAIDPAAEPAPTRLAAGSQRASVLVCAAFALLALRLAVMLAGGAGLYVDEAQYWDWSRQLQWGYWSKPPGVVALIAASTALFGDGIAGVRLLCMATWPLAAAVLWQLGRRMDGPATGLWAATLFVATPAAGLLGMVATTDGPLVLCWALVMRFTWEAIQPDQPQARRLAWWAAAGASVGLGLLCKYTMGAVVLSWALLLRGDARRNMKGLVVAALVAAGVSLPNLAWNAANDWPTFRHTADITVDAAAAHGLGRMYSALEFAAGQLLMLGPIALVVAWRAGRRPHDEDTLDAPGLRGRAFALCFAAPLLAIGLLQSLHAKAQINWAAPALLGACLWIALRARSLGVLAAWRACAAGVSLATLLSLLGQWTGQPRLDLWARMRAWDAALASLQPTLDLNPGLSVVSQQRDLIAHASYAWRATGRTAMAWPAVGRPRNHYEQFRSLPAKADRWPPEVLLLSAQPPDGDMRSRYRHWQLLGSAGSARIHLELWRGSDPEGT